LNVTKEFDQCQLFGVGIIVAVGVGVGVFVGITTGVEVAVEEGLTSGIQEVKLIATSKTAVLTFIFIIPMLCKKMPNGVRY